MDAKRVFEEAEAFLMGTYKRSPVLLQKGRGMQVFGHDGKAYLDFVGGIATNVLGHCPAELVVAVQKQAQKLIHASNLYYMEPQVKLAKLLVENSFAEKVFFCNSGTEAVEAAIKLARKYAKENRSPERFEIITALNSFHGRTLGALAATGQKKLHQGFEPMPEGFTYVPFDDIKALQGAINKKTCAVMLEPVQGEGGVRVPGPDYLKCVRELCDEHGLLLILDEVQTGMGRTGKLFAYEHFDAIPDIMTLAKGLGGGVPIGAVLATKAVAGAFGPGTHGSTFGGGPIAAAAATATLKAVLEDGYLLERCTAMGRYLVEGCNALKKQYPGIVIGVRGLGLLVGMETAGECGPIVEACLERGVLVNCAAGNVLRFMPALIVSQEDIDRLMDVLAEVLGKMS